MMILGDTVNSLQLKMLCLSSSAFLSFSVEKLLSPKHLESLWQVANKNMNTKQVGITISPGLLDLAGGCGNSKIPWGYQHRISCVLSTLRSQLNFTARRNAPKEEPEYGFIKGNHVQSCSHLKGMDCPPVLTLYDSNAYLIVREEERNIYSIARPFDFWTWIGILLSFIATFVLLTMITCKRDERFCSQLFWVIAIVFEQSQRWMANVRSKHAVCILIMTWSFTVLILTNGYKGLMYTHLTAVTLPEVFNSLEEVGRSGLPLFTVGHLQVGREANKLSVFKMILDELINFNKETASESYLRIQRDIETIKSSLADVVKTIVLKERFMTDETKKGIQVPPAFVLASAKWQLEFIYAALKCVGLKDQTIVLSPPLKVFQSRNQFSVKRKYSQHLIYPIMSRIEASGLYEYWHKWRGQYEFYDDLRRSLKSLNYSEDLALFASKEQILTIHLKIKDPKSLSLINVYPGLLLYLILLLLSFLFLALESVVMQEKRRGRALLLRFSRT
jgi:hypothetical protein